MWEMDAAECVPAFDLDSVITSSCSTVAVVSVLVSLTCNFLTELDGYVSFMRICDAEYFAHCRFFAYFSKECICIFFPHKLSSLMALIFFGCC